MTHEQTADLLNRAAARHLQSYFAEVENEADCRWNGELAQADGFREAAEDVRSLIVECRVAAAEIVDELNTYRSRERRRGGTWHAGLPS